MKEKERGGKYSEASTHIRDNISFAIVFNRGRNQSAVVVFSDPSCKESAV